MNAKREQQGQNQGKRRENSNVSISPKIATIFGLRQSVVKKHLA
jgi:chromatin remodeling complex protein RSC6